MSERHTGIFHFLHHFFFLLIDSKVMIEFQAMFQVIFAVCSGKEKYFLFI